MLYRITHRAGTTTNGKLAAVDLDLPDDLSPPGLAALRELVARTKVAVPAVDMLARASALDELVDAGLAYRWEANIGTPSSRGHAGAVVTRSAWLASALGVRLNDRSTRWVSLDHVDRTDRRKPRQDDPNLPGHSLVVSEADLTLDDRSISLDDWDDPDGRTPLDCVVDAEELDRLSDGGKSGWARPQTLDGMGTTWPVDSPIQRHPDGSPIPGGFVQDRWPYIDSPVYAKRRPDRQATCPACGGNPREACAVCHASTQDRKIPREIRRLKVELDRTDRRNIERGTVPTCTTPKPNSPVKPKREKGSAKREVGLGRPPGRSRDVA